MADAGTDLVRALKDAGARVALEHIWTEGEGTGRVTYCTVSVYRPDPEWAGFEDFSDGIELTLTVVDSDPTPQEIRERFEARSQHQAAEVIYNNMVLAWQAEEEQRRNVSGDRARPYNAAG